MIYHTFACLPADGWASEKQVSGRARLTMRTAYSGVVGPESFLERGSGQTDFSLRGQRGAAAVSAVPVDVSGFDCICIECLVKASKRSFSEA